MLFLQIFSKTFLCILFLFHPLVFADPPYPFCSSEASNFTDSSPFQKNLNNLYNILSLNASVSKFYSTSTGQYPNTVYGLFMCYNYVSQESCKSCINSASQSMPSFCPNKMDAVLYLDNCQLRHSNQEFLGQLNVSGNIPYWNNQTNPELEWFQFKKIVNQTLHKIRRLAAFNPVSGMYATEHAAFSDTETIYALVQCTIDLTPDECSTCLDIAILNITSCCYKYRGARLWSPSCYVRHEFYNFYEGETGPTLKEGSNKGVEVLGIGLGILVGLTILGLFFYCVAWRNRTNKNTKAGQGIEISNEGGLNDMDQRLLRNYNLNAQQLSFIDMETITVATENFSESNKLGQGGFGLVYKGVMPNGEEVAVKRLSVCSAQGSDEFINEVELILKLQHKNLVRILGFCIHLEEKLLIYEFMPNTSLDHFLMDCRKRAQLNWKKRLNIITGIARGMLYLHQDSRLKIIHRDLKPSNVLLDKDMNPKISDFGMARIFGGTNGEANTSKVVGTYGYMPPEFAMEGLYSVKSDVFSFGVLLLELITGRRNAGFHRTKLAPSLTAYVWKLWNEGKGEELVDPLLSDSYIVDEYMRCMHIGLLCVQEDAYDRPTMASVVLMLNNETACLSKPQRPANFIEKFSDNYETCFNNLTINNPSMSGIAPR